VTLTFATDGIARLAEIASQINARTENIGARRLHTVLERLLENLSFEATDSAGSTVVVDAAYVDKQLGALVQDEDLSRYIL
jgi:ATP-dependent HslUV protease ATP-binding subunit HslU